VEHHRSSLLHILSQWCPAARGWLPTRTERTSQKIFPSQAERVFLQTDTHQIDHTSAGFLSTSFHHAGQQAASLDITQEHPEDEEENENEKIRNQKKEHLLSTTSTKLAVPGRKVAIHQLKINKICKKI